ncbi:MAG: CPBP family intramembrane metalloprotease [Leptolinea sp.]|nr:CPBP family intramembrane metalloprotease [Leptolinea sp.]
MQTKTGKKLAVFLAITFFFSILCYVAIISTGTIRAKDGLYVFLLMWSPGIAAIITQLIFEHSLKGLGWKPGKFKYLALAYLLPLGYCLVVYGLTWLTGLGIFPSPQFLKELKNSYPMFSGENAIVIYTGLMMSLGFITSMVSALGEEIGWRGFLVPELAKLVPFSQVGLISGIIWALWHLPLILFANYNLPGTPKWYAVVMFVIMVLGISFAFAWLRLKSGSLWTGVVLHASHNLFVQVIFTPFTALTPVTPYIIDEFGCGLAILAVIVAFLFWRKRTSLVEAPRSESSASI